MMKAPRTIVSLDKPYSGSRMRRVMLSGADEPLVTSAAVVKELGIAAGMSVSSEEELRERIVSTAAGCAKQRALDLLSHHDHTSHEMRVKLAKDGYDSACCDAVLAFLAEYHFIDDERLLDAAVQAGIRTGVGERKLVQNLTRKGFEREHIAEVLASYYSEESVDAQRSAARAVIERCDVATPKGRDKAVRRLVSRGYDFDLINRVIEELRDERDAGGTLV